MPKRSARRCALCRIRQPRSLKRSPHGRRQIIEMMVAEKNRLGSAPKAVKKRINIHLRWLEAELARANKDLDQAIRQSPIWKENEDLLQSAPAIGPTVSRTLIAELPELGLTVNRSLPWSE